MSWDDAVDGPDKNMEDGRSYVSCLSEIETGETCVGAAKNTMGEGRMDISSSEMAYLGYEEPQNHGGFRTKYEVSVATRVTLEFSI